MLLLSLLSVNHNSLIPFTRCWKVLGFTKKGMTCTYKTPSTHKNVFPFFVWARHFSVLYRISTVIIFVWTALLTLDFEILGKKLSCIICTDIFEFVAAKFNSNLIFVKFFISSYWLEIVIHIVLNYFLKHKIYTDMFTQKCNKFGENKLTLEKTEL